MDWQRELYVRKRKHVAHGPVREVVGGDAAIADATPSIGRLQHMHGYLGAGKGLKHLGQAPHVVQMAMRHCVHTWSLDGLTLACRCSVMGSETSSELSSAMPQTTQTNISDFINAAAYLHVYYHW
jgi:hypothetical protein